MTDDQKVRLLTAFADLDDAVLARLHDASSVRWRSAVDIGGQRQVAWYLARHAAEHVAAVRGFPDYIGYKIGYVPAAVSHRDQLTDDQFQAITQPWQVAVGPLSAAVRDGCRRPDRCGAADRRRNDGQRGMAERVDVWRRTPQMCRRPGG